MKFNKDVSILDDPADGIQPDPAAFADLPDSPDDEPDEDDYFCDYDYDPEEAAMWAQHLEERASRTRR